MNQLISTRRFNLWGSTKGRPKQMNRLSPPFLFSSRSISGSWLICIWVSLHNKSNMKRGSAPQETVYKDGKLFESAVGLGGSRNWQRSCPSLSPPPPPPSPYGFIPELKLQRVVAWLFVLMDSGMLARSEAWQNERTLFYFLKEALWKYMKFGSSLRFVAVLYDELSHYCQGGAGVPFYAGATCFGTETQPSGIVSRRWHRNSGSQRQLDW